MIVGYPRPNDATMAVPSSLTARGRQNHSHHRSRVHRYYRLAVGREL
jgi:hypothetical protein